MYNLLVKYGEFTLERSVSYSTDIEKVVDVKYRLTDKYDSFFMIGYYSGIPCLLEHVGNVYTITWLNMSPIDVYKRGIAAGAIDPVRKQFVYYPGVFVKWKESITDKDQLMIDNLASNKELITSWDNWKFMRTVLASNISKRLNLEKDIPVIL